MLGVIDVLPSKGQLGVEIMRLAFITLEFSADTFSGNGIYAQSQVRALSSLGHDVVVLAARPLFCKDPPERNGAVELIEIPVTSWGRLDSKAPWKEFADGATRDEIPSRLAKFNCQAVVGIDWSSWAVYQALQQTWISMKTCRMPPYVFSSYRIFSRTNNEEEREMMERMERSCFMEAAGAMVLCRSDRDFALKHLIPSPCIRSPAVLLPPLRQDVADLPLPRDIQIETVGFNESRPYITCCVRLSEEKEPHRFVDIVAEMQQRGLLEKFKLVPFLCGSANSVYAQEVKRRLKEAVPNCILEERFLDCEEMAKLYAKTRLNIHPCSHDAYGMTIVEAASQGAPSVVAGSGNVGATDLLRSGEDEVICIDFSKEISTIVEEIESCLSDSTWLKNVGVMAASRARSYTEEANGVELLSILSGVLSGKG